MHTRETWSAPETVCDLKLVKERREANDTSIIAVKPVNAGGVTVSKGRSQSGSTVSTRGWKQWNIIPRSKASQNAKYHLKSHRP